ncbi:hypothetical protein PTKIN_Ptkin09bG0269800 [Pterospermum kingtungense]
MEKAHNPSYYVVNSRNAADERSRPLSAKLDIKLGVGVSGLAGFVVVSISYSHQCNKLAVNAFGLL